MIMSTRLEYEKIDETLGYFKHWGSIQAAFESLLCIPEVTNFEAVKNDQVLIVQARQALTLA